MNQSQNLCLICCYSFQEKRSRFISDEARESFRKFCVELGLSIGDGEAVAQAQKKGLDLPYGENITVCGDCLSLVVLYVQRRTIQSGKEEKLLELQKAVCAALKDLQDVLEEVQGHIDELHNTIRTGDESSLDSFCSVTSAEADKENNPRAFRAKILELHTGLIKSKSVQKTSLTTTSHGVPINIKLEPRDEDYRISMNDNDDADDGNYDDGDGTFFAPDDEPTFGEDDFQTQDFSSADTEVDKKVEAKPSRRKRKVVKNQYREDFPPSPDPDDGTGFDDQDFKNDQREPAVVKRRKKRGPKGVRVIKPLKKPKTEQIASGSNIHEVEEAALQWKDDLIGRIVMQMNDDAHDLPADTENANQPLNEACEDPESSFASNTFQFIDGKLKFREVFINIREKHRELECKRCRKKYFQKRDANGEDVRLELLMRDHILSKHIGKIRHKTKFPTIEVLEYTSTTKSKITYKLACSQRYSYTRRATNPSGGEYFRCDYRSENCGATILHKEGVYYRMCRGWNPDGSHAIHAPDVERTNRQIEIGRAKAMFLTNSTKSIDDVCEDILNQSNGQLNMPLNRLKERMIYAKYHTSGMPESEKSKLSYPCPHCSDKVFKLRRHLTRHIRHHHDPSGAVPSSSKKLPSARKPSTAVTKKAKKIKSETKPVIAEAPEPPALAEGPSIVFNDPSVASNFVNKCISAIMQQVGLSVTGNSSTQVRPISSELQRDHHPSTSTSPAPSDISQQETIPPHQVHGHHSRGGNASHGPPPNSGQWQQPSSSQSGGHPGFPPHQNPSGSNNQQVPGWPWALH